MIDFAVGSLPPSPRRMGDAVERSHTVSALPMLFITRMLGALMLREVVPNRIGAPFERSIRAVDIALPRFTDTGSRYGSVPPETITEVAPVSSTMLMRESGTLPA